MAQQLQAQELIGHRLLDQDGNNVGKIGQVFYDDQTETPKWVTVRTGFFGTHENFVPLRGAETVEEGLRVPYGKDTIKNAPHFDVDQHISAEEENDIYNYYDIQPEVPQQRREEQEGVAGAGEEGRSQAGPATEQVGMETGEERSAEARQEGQRERARQAGAESEAGAESAMTRSEEQVNVGTQRQESGQARLRKHVESEEFEETVPVTHEEVRVERQPVSEAGTTEREPQMEEAEETFTLYEERPVVSKENVPVEEVKVKREQVTEEEKVRGERRKERIDVEQGEEEPRSES